MQVHNAILINWVYNVNTFLKFFLQTATLRRKVGAVQRSTINFKPYFTLQAYIFTFTAICRLFGLSRSAHAEMSVTDKVKSNFASKITFTLPSFNGSQIFTKEKRRYLQAIHYNKASTTQTHTKQRRGTTKDFTTTKKAKYKDIASKIQKQHQQIQTHTKRILRQIKKLIRQSTFTTENKM